VLCFQKDQCPAGRWKTLAPILLGNKCLRENKILTKERVNIMSIEKKSLLSTLKSAKKANVIKDEISVDAMSRNAGAKAQPANKLSIKSQATAKLSTKAQAVKKLAVKAAVKSSMAMKMARK